MTKEVLDSFFEAFAAPLTLCAGEGFRQHGRGLLLVGFRHPAEGPMPPGWAQYIPLHVLEQMGFSLEMAAFVKSYDPAHDFVAFVNCGDGGRIIKMELERGANEASANN